MAGDQSERPTEGSGPERERWSVRFRGRVQGVGFRFTTCQLARSFPDVTGYVRNCADGSVELVMEGPPAQMRGLLNAVRKTFAGNITDCTVRVEPYTGEFERFGIAY